MAGLGIFWFLGSTVIGVLYGVSLLLLITLSLVAELAAIPLFLLARRRLVGLLEEILTKMLAECY